MLCFILVYFIGYFMDAMAIDGATNYPKKPNIVILMADDLGFDDVSFRGSSQILTPNIDAIGYQGVILNRHYVPNLCTPSRAALLTGRYPINIGMQHNVIANCDPHGLPLNLRILPQYLKEAGYRTHLVGKWHLGFSRKAYIPTRRGFDEFFGFYTSGMEYFENVDSVRNYTGHALRRNETVSNEGRGVYLTHVLSDEAVRIVRNHNVGIPLFLLVTYNAPHTSVKPDPESLEAPKEEMDKLMYIADPEVRAHAAMVTTLDKGIGKIIAELGQKKMLNDSIVIFYSDNGAPTKGLFSTRGTNFPLKGQKDTMWEGGSRVVATLWSSALEVRHIVSNHLIYNADWLPTFLALAGVKAPPDLDGFNIWPTLTLNLPSPRTEIIHSINTAHGVSSLYYRGWKYVNGSTHRGLYDTWLGSAAKQTNPLASKYVDIVRGSPAWKAFAPFALKHLKKKKIKKIRKKARIECQEKLPYATECTPLKEPCLFRIDEDECEINNLARAYPHKAHLLANIVEGYRAKMVDPVNEPADYEGCDPAKHNGVFTWWLDVDKSSNK
ncbi:arylsulfatase B-like [Lutzomyia longipalpis]|uniref:arylsulfatase B-like n=1 Tax=Lutzomyia longipalpis TaxID=7200 RepID=UPI0024834FA7|nr:arylsulfatase B-like [Lutzomyia longipalpis]